MRPPGQLEKLLVDEKHYFYASWACYSVTSYLFLLRSMTSADSLICALISFNPVSLGVCLRTRE